MHLAQKDFEGKQEQLRKSKAGFSSDIIAGLGGAVEFFAEDYSPFKHANPHTMVSALGRRVVAGVQQNRDDTAVALRAEELRSLGTTGTHSRAITESDLDRMQKQTAFQNPAAQAEITRMREAIEKIPPLLDRMSGESLIIEQQ